jgi:hypothetical protein
VCPRLCQVELLGDILMLGQKFRFELRCRTRGHLLEHGLVCISGVDNSVLGGLNGFLTNPGGGSKISRYSNISANRKAYS